MRKLLFIIAIASSICLAAQNDKRPSNSEVQTQMKQAASEAKKQRDDIKKQIADAKANNEDPATIKQLEDQLATLDKMVNMLEGTNLAEVNKPPTLAPSKIVEPKYISPFEPITLKQPIKTPTNEQATDELLWYKGKKIDSRTLITTTRMLVRYDNQRNVVVVQPDKQRDTSYYGLLNTLAKTGKMKNDFVFAINGMLNSFLMYPEIQETYDEFDLMKDRYYDVAKNVIPLPPQSNNLDRLFTELTQLLNNLPDVNVLVMPPELHRPLCPCNSGKKLYEQNLNDWLNNKFSRDEDLLLFKYMQIYEYLEDTRQKKSTAQSAVLNEAIRQVVVRKTQKLLNLYTAYSSENIYLEDGLVMATTNFRRDLSEIVLPQDGIMFSIKGDAINCCEQIKRSVFSDKVFTDFIDDQKRQKNHEVVLDYSFFLNHEWNKQAFDENYIIPHSAIWAKNMEKYNRFTLTINLNFNLEQQDEQNNNKVLMTATGQLSSDAVTVSLDRNECNWSFHLTNPNYRNRSANENIFYLPFNVAGGVKDYPDDKYPPFNYIGPAKMMMVFPIFKLVFCNPTNNPFASPDTIIMNTLRYTDADLNNHISSHHVQTARQLDFGREYSLDMLDYVNKMFIVIKEVKDNSATFVDITSKMLHINDVSNLSLPTSNSILNQLFVEYKKNLERKDLQFQTSENFHNDYTKISLSKINNSILYNQSTDLANARDKDKAYGFKLVRALVSVKVVHAPQ